MRTETAAKDRPRLFRWFRERQLPRFTRSETVFAYLLNLPALITIFVLVAYPIGYSFYLSLQRYNLKRPDQRAFIGVENYWEVLRSDVFLNSIKVSVIFSVLSVTFIVIISVILALLLNETFRGRGAMRSLVLLPWAIPGVVNGLMWSWIFNARVGALNGFLYDLGIIEQYRTWLSNPNTALVFASLAHVWNVTPFSVIILLAGLSSIPSELYDAATVDRANVFQRFRHVTLPWLLHPLLIVLILQTMNAFRVFDLIYVMTGGGPGNATNVIALETVRTTLDFTDFGRGNTYAYIIMLITLGLALLYIKVLYRRGSFEV